MIMRRQLRANPKPLLMILCVLTMSSCTSRSPEVQGLPSEKTLPQDVTTVKPVTIAATSDPSNQSCDASAGAVKVVLRNATAGTKTSEATKTNEATTTSEATPTEPSDAKMKTLKALVDKRIKSSTLVRPTCRPISLIEGTQVAAYIPAVMDPKKLFAITSGVQFRPVLQELPIQGIAEARQTLENNPATRSTAILVSKDNRAYLVGPNEISPSPVASAAANVSQNGMFAIDIQMSKQGTADFNTMATRNAGKQVAIVVDDVVISAPVVNGPDFPDGRIQITGNFTEAEASALAQGLASEPFPFEIVSADQNKPS